MLNGVVVLCTIVSPIEVARGPIKQKFPCDWRNLSQWKRKYMYLLLRWMMVLFTTPAAVELSVWIEDGGCLQPISINVWRMGTIYLAVMYIAPSSDSAAEDITNLMIWEIMRIDPFHLGVGSFSDKNMWAPARLQGLDSLLNPASEWAARIMSLAR